MPPKHKPRPESVRTAFARFVELIRPLHDVRYVSLPDSGPAEVFTYIKEWNPQLCLQVATAEDAITEQFPETEIEFHIRYLEGRSIDEMVMSRPSLFFAREPDA